MGAFMRYVLLVSAALSSGWAQVDIIIDNPTTTTISTTTVTTRTETITTSTSTVTTSTITTTSRTATTRTITTTAETVITETVTTSTITTTPLCILDEWQAFTFDDPTRGHCVDENQTEVIQVWRGGMTDEECACECQSEPLCDAYGYFMMNQACALYGPLINQGWGPGTRLWRLENGGWREGALWGTQAKAWEVGGGTSIHPVVAGYFAFGDYVAEADPNDWYCRLKINVTIETPPPDNIRFMCPLGENNSMLGCNSQQILVIFFVFISPVICICSFTFVLLQYLKLWDDICACFSSIFCGCRRPKRGKERCGDFGKRHGKLGWHVERVKEDTENLRRGSASDEEEGEEEDQMNSAEVETNDPKGKKKKKPKRKTRTHVIWDLDTHRVAEVIGAKAELRKQEQLAIADGDMMESVLGVVPEVPPYLEGRAIPASSVDLSGIWGNYMITAKIKTTERDGVIIGKLMRKGEDGMGAPKVLMMHEACLRWVVPDEEGNLFEVEGRTTLNDGQEHTVGVAFDNETDTHTLIVDGQPDGCRTNMPSSEDDDKSRLIIGSEEWPTHWNFVTPNGRFHFFGQVWDIRWNGGIVAPHIGQDLDMPPTAFKEGESVEYYSKTHGMWMLGQVTAKEPDENEDGSLTEVSYSVTMPASKQTRHNVGIDFMRLPMAQGEPCEVFSVSRAGNRWKQGEVQKAKIARSLPSYMVRPTRAAASATTLVTATVTRRRYTQGSRVFVYHEPVQGWTGAWTVARVLAPNLNDARQSNARDRGWAPGEEPVEDGGVRKSLGNKVSGPLASDATVMPMGNPLTGADPSSASSAELGAMSPVKGPTMSNASGFGTPVGGPSMSNASFGMSVGGPNMSSASGFGMPVQGASLSTASNLSNSSSKLAGRVKAPKDSDGAELGYWTMVAVQEDGSADAKRVNVPSYLIRLAPKSDEDNPNAV